MSSGQNTFTSSSSSSYSFSGSTTSSNGQTTGQRSTQQTYKDPSGNTTINSAVQNLGEPAVQDTRSYDAQGRELLGGSATGSASRKIEDVSDEEQAARDREYEERIEDEYAKREGGA